MCLFSFIIIESGKIEVEANSGVVNDLCIL